MILKNLNDLPVSIKSHFDKLAELAYEGTCVNSQVTFPEEDLPSGLDTLGLMQSSMELHIDAGAKTSFNFLHLTIQEFLAAYHISHHLRIEDFYKCGSWMIVTFFCGLSPSKFLEHVTQCRISGPATFDEESIRNF